jgi:2-methylisocitrate lyase-like PEP mutase family enzyme
MSAQENFGARRRDFRALHEAGSFVIPNPWDIGSARYLQQLGLPALATTSAGCAFSLGLPDSEVALAYERNLAYIADVAGAVDVPVTADFGSGYGESPPDVADNVTRCVATGVAGLSIEDGTGDRSSPLYELPLAIERVRAAREAIDESGADVLLTARAECFHAGHHHPLRESVRRLQAFAEAERTCYSHPAPTICPILDSPDRGDPNYPSQGENGDRGS